MVGGIAGVIGALQAAEAIKFLTGEGELSADCLVSYDALSGRWRRIALSRNPRCPICATLSVDAAATRARWLDAPAKPRYGG